MKKSLLFLAGALMTHPLMAAFAVDLPIVTHAAGATTTFYTSLDVTNNTSQPTGVSFEYISSDLSVDAVGTLTATLGGHGNFHTDDVLGFLGSQGFITAAQAANGFGTMLLTFSNPAFTTGTEASASVRIYNYVNAGSPASVGLAYRGQVLRRNGSHTLYSVVNNTTAVTNGTPQVVTNLGLENIGIDDTGAVTSGTITLQLTFYDPVTGNQVGPQPTVTLAPGQVMQLNDLWTKYSLPAGSNQLQLTVAETSGTAQIRGYLSVKDIITSDGSFFFMQ